MRRGRGIWLGVAALAMAAGPGAAGAQDRNPYGSGPDAFDDKWDTGIFDTGRYDYLGNMGAYERDADRLSAYDWPYSSYDATGWPYGTYVRQATEYPASRRIVDVPAWFTADWERWYYEDKDDDGMLDQWEEGWFDW